MFHYIYSLNTDEYFAVSLSKLLYYFRIDDETAARLFDVSRPTLKRWKSGLTAPYSKDWIVDIFLEMKKYSYNIQ